jgi:hypothetical protein
VHLPPITTPPRRRSPFHAPQRSRPPSLIARLQSNPRAQNQPGLTRLYLAPPVANVAGSVACLGERRPPLFLGAPPVPADPLSSGSHIPLVSTPSPSPLHLTSPTSRANAATFAFLQLRTDGETTRPGAAAPSSPAQQSHVRLTTRTRAPDERGDGLHDPKAPPPTIAAALSVPFHWRTGETSNHPSSRCVARGCPGLGCMQEKKTDLLLLRDCVPSIDAGLRLVHKALEVCSRITLLELLC